MPVRLTILLLLISSAVAAQPQQRLTVEAAIDTALTNNRQLLVNQAEIRKAGYLVKTSGEIPKTGFFVENEDYRPTDQTGILKIGMSQSVAWPGLYAARKNYYNEQLEYARMGTSVLNAEIIRSVKSTYFQLWYLQDKAALYLRLDSIYTFLYEVASLRFTTGEVAGLDKIAAEAKMRELQALMQQNTKDMLVLQQQLMVLLNSEERILPLNAPLEKIGLVIPETDSLHPLLAMQQQQIQIAASAVAVQKNTNRPEFSGRFFNQRLWGADNPFSGFSVMATFPLFGAGAYKNRVSVANAEREVAENRFAYHDQQLRMQKQAALTEIEKNRAMLKFYETTGLQQAEEILRAVTQSYRSGEISFAELSQFLSQAIGTRQYYLDALNGYNQSVIRYNYLNNRQ